LEALKNLILYKRKIATQRKTSDELKIPKQYTQEEGKDKNTPRGSKYITTTT